MESPQPSRIGLPARRPWPLLLAVLSSLCYLTGGIASYEVPGLTPPAYIAGSVCMLASSTTTVFAGRKIVWPGSWGTRRSAAELVLAGFIIGGVFSLAFFAVVPFMA